MHLCKCQVIRRQVITNAISNSRSNSVIATRLRLREILLLRASPGKKRKMGKKEAPSTTVWWSGHSAYLDGGTLQSDGEPVTGRAVAQREDLRGKVMLGQLTALSQVPGADRVVQAARPQARSIGAHVDAGRAVRVALELSHQRLVVQVPHGDVAVRAAAEANLSASDTETRARNQVSASTQPRPPTAPHPLKRVGQVNSICLEQRPQTNWQKERT